MFTKIPGFPGADELRLVDDGAADEPHGVATFNAGAAPSDHRHVERRRGPRRQTAERRAEIRFEPGRPDRRDGIDRRKGGWKSNFTV